MSGEYFPQWEREGFSSAPEEIIAEGNEKLLRAYCKTISPTHDFVSRKVGNCFFVPTCGLSRGAPAAFTIDRGLWTGAFLEQRLNAFVFGNGYERIGVWMMNPGTRYRIGFVGFDTRTTAPVASTPEFGPQTLYRHQGSVGDDPFFFRQIVLVLTLPKNFDQLEQGKRKQVFEEAVLSCVRPVDDIAVVMPLTSRIGHA